VRDHPSLIASALVAKTDLGTKIIFNPNMIASSAGNLGMPIVLTATIVPNQVDGAAANPQARLAEYLKTLQFYSEHAPVIFLENSGYPLERHREFAETARLRVKRFPPSAHPGRGKGYQEFEMLDAWLAAEENPPVRWLKISGRYQLHNIDAILNECRTEQRGGLIIDQVARTGLARTYSFCADTDFYRQQLGGLYQQCDDRTSEWIERVLFRKLKTVPAGKVRFFVTQPRITAIAGSSGAAFPSGRSQWLVKQMLRNLNRLVDRKYLLYSK
jgi:hypothetical protein